MHLYLLDLSCSTTEQLDVSLAQDLFVLLQGILGIFLTSKENKRITCGTSIWVLHKQKSLHPVRHRALWAQEAQNILRSSSERKPAHSDYHLVFLRKELSYLIGRACQKRRNCTFKMVSGYRMSEIFSAALKAFSRYIHTHCNDISAGRCTFTPAVCEGSVKLFRGC